MYIEYFLKKKRIKTYFPKIFTCITNVLIEVRIHKLDVPASIYLQRCNLFNIFRDIYFVSNDFTGRNSILLLRMILVGRIYYSHKDSSCREMFAKRNEKSSERVALSSCKKKKKGKDGDPPLPSNRIVTSSCVRGRWNFLLLNQYAKSV